MVGVNIGYLICRECKGYYQLEDEENPDDFESCHCGGELMYTQHFDNLSTVLAFADMDEEQQKKLNEILDLEQTLQNKSNPYYGDSEQMGSLLNKLSDSLGRGMGK